MITLIVDDCTIEVTPKTKGMSVISYDISIVGHETIEVPGPREFSNLMKVIQDLVLNAIANIDTNGYMGDY